MTTQQPPRSLRSLPPEGAAASLGAARREATPPLLDTLQRGLAELDAQGLRRVRRTADTACDAHMRVDGRDIIGFASNDYLGLAAHPALVAAFAEGAQRYGSGSGGSHLLGGHSRAHAMLEDELAGFAGGFSDAPRALYFSTGYMANLAAMTALTAKDATIFSDALNHASLIDGIRLSRANVQVYPHADTAALATLLDASDAETKLIVSDTVFSMDGDIAPLAELVALAERHGAWLVVDDAHGFGVLGPQGRGALAAAALRSPNLVYVGTLGKAAGVAGAFVIAHETVIEWMIQRARSYIFTTAVQNFNDFGVVGRYSFPFEAGDYTVGILTDLAVQGDGKVVAAGVAAAPFERNFAIARLFLTGDEPLDTSFSGDGRIVHSFDTPEEETDSEVSAVTLAQGGKITVAGNGHGAVDGVVTARYWNSYIFVDGFEWGVLASTGWEVAP